MTVVAQDLRDHFPEFDTLSDAFIERWLDQASRRVNDTQWGEKADDGVLWLTAHLLKLQCQISGGATAAAGPISQKRVGDLSVTYALPKGRLSESFLASTTYGQYYLDLLRTIFPTRVLDGTVTVNDYD